MLHESVPTDAQIVAAAALEEEGDKRTAKLARRARTHTRALCHDGVSKMRGNIVENALCPNMFEMVSPRARGGEFAPLL